MNYFDKHTLLYRRLQDYISECDIGPIKLAINRTENGLAIKKRVLKHSEGFIHLDFWVPISNPVHL